MKIYYKSYGVTASITPHRNGTATLKMSCGPYFKFKKTYKSLQGAKIAYGKFSN